MTIPGSTIHRQALAVLALCFTLGLLGRGAAESFVVFLLPVAETLGGDRATVVSVYSTMMLAMGLSAPLVGRVFDRFGPRRLYALGMLSLGGGLSLAAHASAVWHLHICLGLAVGFASAALGNVPNSALVSRWFSGRLASATGVVFSALGAGVLVMVPLAQLLIDAFGWRNAYQVMGAGALALLLPLLVLPWRRIEAGSGPAGSTVRPDAAMPSWTLRRAIRKPAFWGLFSVFFFTGAGMISIAAQAVAFFVDAGFPPLQAAAAWGITGVLAPVGMVGFGWLDERIGRRRSVGLSYAMTLLAIPVLWQVGRTPSLPLLAAFVLLFGVTLGSRGPLITTMAVGFFRGGNIGSILGSISLGGGFGAAVGSLAGGLLHDWSGGYDAVLAFAFVMVVTGSLPFWTMSALKRE